MRILALSDSYPPDNLGGAGEVAHLVSTRLASWGHEVNVITATTRRAHAGRVVQDGLTVHRIWAPVPPLFRLHLGLYHPLMVAQVRRIASRLQSDVVHAHNVHERLSFGALGASRPGRSAAERPPLVLTAHDYLLFCLTKFLCSNGDVRHRADPSSCPHCRHIRRVPGRNRSVHHMVSQHTATIACISHAQRTALSVNGFGDVPLEVVYNGLDPDMPAISAQARQAFRAEHGLDRRPLVLFGGRISGAKGGDQLLRAVARARSRIDCQLAIVGDRPAYFQHARNLAEQVGVPQNSLHTLGWLPGDALHRAFASADVCATPAVYPDPFNLMTLRAMLHEKPVVGTCYGATPEIVVDGETGFIADPWDPETFGNRLADLLDDAALASRMGAAGRVRASSFTLDRQVKAYLALYERLTAR
jgi:glycosyltransferase involved in cell wall biosynthesis